jgi:hypothetical protein
VIAAANILTDLFLSLAAVCGLVTLHRSLTAQSPFDPLTRRFLFGIRVTILLFGGRALVVLTGGAWFQPFVLLAAALVPLAVLVLTEGLLRRHAAAQIKLFAASGAVVFAILAFLPAGILPGVRTWVLLGFQLVTLGACGWMVVMRDKASLSVAENDTAVRLGLSLILLIPMIAADFLMVYLRLPVQISALGVLVLCWLAIGLGQMQGGHRTTIMTFSVTLAVAVVTGAFIGLVTDTGRDGVILSIAVILAAMLVVMILNDARQGRASAQSLTLLRHMARGPQDDALAFLRGLQDHRAVEGAALVSEQALADLDAGVLDRVFAAHPVLRRSALPALDPVAEDHVRHLFDRYAASHIMQVTPEPRRFIALAMPTLASSARAELELDAVQRMAALIARTEKGT